MFAIHMQNVDSYSTLDNLVEPRKLMSVLLEDFLPASICSSPAGGTRGVEVLTATHEASKVLRTAGCC